MSEVKISEENVAESLKIILVKKGSNISKLAELMGVTSTTMYSKFKRANFTIKDLDEISKALGISYDITFTIDNGPKDSSGQI